MATDTSSFDARPLVDSLLLRAVDAGASDVHFEPADNGYEIRFRIDGLLQSVDTVPTDVGRALALRLMVMAQLLTYKLDLPQEGRVRVERAGGAALDLRLAVIPVARGLRAVVRLPAELLQPRRLDDLGLSANVLATLQAFARTDTGMLIITGPAGSGKTTTIYALLEYIARVEPGLSIISIEDPVERILTGVTQIEVSTTAAGNRVDYDLALRSILRQDPQVLMLGEIRDAQTASIAVQAALSGHRLICTLHAGSPGGAIARLLEMGLEPYQLTSSVWGVLSQRLLRKCDGDKPGVYRGRVPVAEVARMEERLRGAILQRGDDAALQKFIAIQPSHVRMMDVARALVARGVTDSSEVARVLGMHEESSGG